MDPVVVAAVIGAVAAIIAALIPLVIRRRSSHSDGTTTPAAVGQAATDLRLVDISLEAPSDREFPILDIKLRNLGAEVVFLKRAVFTIRDRGDLRNPQTGSYRFTRASRNYNVMFRDSGEIVKSISHAIAPNSVDRFTFTLACDGGDPVMPTLFWFGLSLIYDEDDKAVDVPSIIVAIPGAKRWKGFTPEGYDETSAERNAKILKRFSAYEGISSDATRNLLRELA